VAWEEADRVWNAGAVQLVGFSRHNPPQTFWSSGAGLC
jgi:hypothetical protein